MSVAALILAILVASAFGAAGFLKLIEHPKMVENSKHLGTSMSMTKVVGLLELAGGVGLVAGLAFLPLGVAAAIGLVLLMIGAVIFHMRASDSLREVMPSVLF